MITRFSLTSLKSFRRSCFQRVVTCLALICFGPGNALPVLFAQDPPPNDPPPFVPKDAFVADWVAPEPVLTPEDITQNEAVVVDGPDFANFSLPQTPTVDEITECQALGNPFCFTSDQEPADAEKQSLATALSNYCTQGGQDHCANVHVLEDFVAAYPQSSFQESLWLEIGDIYRKHGFFIRARDAWKVAWDRTKSLAGEEGKRLAERALFKYVTILSQLGQKAELDTVMAEIKDRELGGTGEEARYRGLTAQYFFHNQAEQNVFCGFTALNEVCVPLGKNPVFPDVHDPAEELEFITNGLSLFELRAHSHETGGDIKLIKRTDPTAEVPVPSVIHWTFGHYSAALEKDDNGSVLVKDFHLKFNAWVEPMAIDEQASGYFAVPGDHVLGAGYELVTDAEAQTIFGRHCSHEEDDEEPD